MAEAIHAVYDDFQHFKGKNHALLMLPCKNHAVRYASPESCLIIERAYHVWFRSAKEVSPPQAENFENSRCENAPPKRILSFQRCIF